MNNGEITQRLKELKIEDFIWVIYIGIIFFSWFANSLERKYFVFNDVESRDKYRKVMTGIFIVLVIVYFYFLRESYNDLKDLKPTDSDKRKELVTLSFIASLLIFISGIIILYIVVSDEYICDNIRSLMQKDILGATKQDKKIVIDYGGPNVAKPLHVGHLRTAIIGQAINNILKFVGNETIGDVHLGDIGTQMGQVIYGILQDFPNTKYEDINFDLDYLNKTYPKISALCKEDEKVREKCLEITKQNQDGDPNYRILWKKINEVSVSDIKRIYDYLDVHFDLWYGESHAYKYFDEMMSFIEKQGIIKIDDGAKIIDIKEKDDKMDYPPCMLQKSDGAYLYATSDLGTIWQREKDFHPDNIIYVVDNRQSMYFTQVFRAAKKAHIYDGVLEHYGNGTVNGSDNKPFKTREGGTLKLEQLIEEVKKEFINMREENKHMDKEDLDKIVNAIIKFADLQNDLERNYIFDIKKFSEVNGKTGPYILYTIVRIKSILNRYAESGKSLEACEIQNASSASEKALMLEVAKFNQVIENAYEELAPHKICAYIYDLSNVFNRFYHETKILSEEDETKQAGYIALLTLTKKVLEACIDVLGFEAPERM